MIIPEKDELLQTKLYELCESFEKWVGIASEGRPDNPARHLHIKTIERLEDVGLDSIFEDALFFDYLYATLAIWGMDSRGARLSGFHSFANGIRGNREKISELRDQTLSKVAQSDTLTLNTIMDAIWEILESMNVSETEIQLVAGSKALHHILPHLVPPVDRQYTLRFFFDNKRISRDLEEQREQFDQVFIGYLYIWEVRQELIGRLTSIHSWNSSVTKTIDNAIIGYQKSRGKR